MSMRTAMLRIVPPVIALSCGDASAARHDARQQTEPFTVTTLVSGLDTPWDLAFGPDSMIWVTERGGRILRVQAGTGDVKVAGMVPVLENGESGLMGLAFHPNFAREPWVYVVHTYSGGNRLVRMRWNGERLGAPEVLLDGIPSGSIHDGSRLAVGSDQMLYMTTGDAGNGGAAQDLHSLSGKILRLDLEGKPAAGNPFGTAVWSYGHRNPQGLVFHPTSGALYATEHGPGDNDEVNLIRRGGNYGWPDVHGKCDDDSGAEREFCRAHNVVEPLVTWTPTVAITGADFYMSNRIPGRRGSLLATSLKDETLYRMTLSSDGARVTSQERLLSNRYGRLRDVLVLPNGDVLVATSNKDGRGSPSRTDDRILLLRGVRLGSD